MDDHRVIAEGLAALIEDTDDLEVVGIAGSARDAIGATATLAPDVILLDHLLPDRTGVEAIGEIKASCPDAAVVMLTSATDDAVLAAAFDAGAAGHLLKTEAAAQVLEAIRNAARGESHISRTALAGVLRRAKAVAPDRRRTDPLTPREMDVLRALAAGRSTSEIADLLGLTISTVRTYVQEILRKLGSRSRLQAVMHAAREGLL
ncbi:MAG: response regulator transcription factor [Chloroflexi bacterium]|nr:response regulator transcription factor [Chloroflexota bacterium]